MKKLMLLTAMAAISLASVTTHAVVKSTKVSRPVAFAPETKANCSAGMKGSLKPKRDWTFALNKQQTPVKAVAKPVLKKAVL